MGWPARRQCKYPYSLGYRKGPLTADRVAGQADFLLVFEQAEALRYADFLKPGGVAIVNDHRIEPITVTSGNAHYPTRQSVHDVLALITERRYLVPGTTVAHELGNARASNIVLLGALSRFLDLPEAAWLEVIEAHVPNKVVEVEPTGVLAGREAVGSPWHER